MEVAKGQKVKTPKGTGTVTCVLKSNDESGKLVPVFLSVVMDETQKPCYVAMESVSEIN